MIAGVVIHVIPAFQQVTPSTKINFTNVDRTGDHAGALSHYEAHARPCYLWVARRWRAAVGAAFLAGSVCCVVYVCVVYGIYVNFYIMLLFLMASGLLKRKLK